jgi:hypothetical protein
MGPLLSRRGRAASSPSILSSCLASEVEPLPQHLAAGYLLPYVVSAEAAYMMRSDRGMVSLSRDAWFARNDPLPMLRLHHFHRPSDGTSGESLASFGLARHSLFSYI